VFGHQKIRYRPPANIEAEVRDLAQRGIKAMFVYDDELAGVKQPDGWMSEIADRIGPLGMVWKGQGRCSQKYITPELMADFYRAGCRVMMWGIESFSQKVLDAIKKGTTPDDIWHTLRVAKAAGIKNWAFTMIGNYGETLEDLAITADALGKAYREGLIDYRQTTVVTALPGTELERLQKRKPVITEEMARAREHGDLRENAEYHAAKETLTKLGQRIVEIESKLSRARIIEDQNIQRDKVYIGATVKLKDLDENDEFEYIIVDKEEANPAERKISIQSPLAQGLLGHKEGDKVDVTLPSGVLRLEILKIS
jgi:transcription elongation factor GreA